MLRNFEEAPTERIVQLHYVGFSSNNKGYLIDDHGGVLRGNLGINGSGIVILSSQSSNT